MTDIHPLDTLIEEYRAGLDAEVVLLHRLESVAALQRDAAAAGDFDAMRTASDERDRLMAALVTVEAPLSDIRRTLAGRRQAAESIPAYADARRQHAQAVEIVERVRAMDDLSVEALADGDRARREEARAAEQGEATLAAYRRVMTAIPGATLVDRRG